MTRRGAALSILTAAALALAAAYWIRGMAPGIAPSVPASVSPGVKEPKALARLREIPFYRALVGSDGLRSCSLDADGSLHLDVNLRAIAARRLRSAGVATMADLVPDAVSGTIFPAGRESWAFPGPVALFDLLDRSPAADLSDVPWTAIPENPDAVSELRLHPERLTDPSFGGEALATWRDRIALVEHLLSHPLREELAQDLAGPVVFALYETGSDADAVVSVELRRSDRIGGLLETLFGLGALTARATVVPYRGVPTGSFRSDSGWELAVAVDGPLLLAASSRARLESAMDARRDDRLHGTEVLISDGDIASWSARTASSFVASSWCQLARCPKDTPVAPHALVATLRPEGEDGWLLESAGPSPALTADPLIPFLRAQLARH